MGLNRVRLVISTLRLVKRFDSVVIELIIIVILVFLLKTILKSLIFIFLLPLDKITQNHFIYSTKSDSLAH
jgi:hypothetical protein